MLLGLEQFLEKEIAMSPFLFTLSISVHGSSLTDQFFLHFPLQSHDRQLSCLSFMLTGDCEKDSDYEILKL